MSSGTCIKRMPPGPGSLIITFRFMPSSGCNRITSTFSSQPLASSKIECGGCLNVIAISEARARSFLPVRR
ncbi:MAG: hypothetical protein ACD_54C00309G0003 [uncultured bacterium]|nr:MAG: hypothetical protein ACD_54C00309G0003 [uncultured bacterium]